MAVQRYRSSAGTLLLGLVFSLSTTGCLSSLHKQTLALSVATTPVIDEATHTYHAAQKMHDLKVDYDAVDDFSKTKTVHPETVVSFPSEQAIHVRLTLLQAFKCYVQSLVEITSGVSSPKLEAAATSVGASLTTIGNRFAPTPDDPLALTAASDSTTLDSTPLISVKGQNILSTAALAFGEFLVHRTIKKELPSKVVKMDADLKTLCKAMLDDIDILAKQEERDLDSIRDRQTLFVQSTMQAGALPLAPDQQRVQVLKIPDAIREHRATQEQFADFRASLIHLYMTHHALAAEIQKNNPRSLQGLLGDLTAAGSDLGKFYSSLPTQ